jgi:hypothetical protein
MRPYVLLVQPNVNMPISEMKIFPQLVKDTEPCVGGLLALAGWLQAVVDYHPHVLLLLHHLQPGLLHIISMLGIIMSYVHYFTLILVK